MKLFGLTITRATPKQTVCRSGGSIARDYKGAEYSNLLADFVLDGGYVPGTMATQLPIMRGRARQEVKNNPWARRIVDLFAVNVVGAQGFAFRPLPPYGNGTIDMQAAAILKEAFWAWQEAPEYADMAGRLDFRGICELMARGLVRDGETFARIIRGNYPANPFAFALQVLNPATCDATLNAEPGQMPKSVGRIVNGVEIDAWGRPLAYWFSEDRFGLYMPDYLQTGGQYLRLPASEIIHCFRPEVPGQTRGVPDLYCVLKRLHHLGEYEEAELVAARKDASITSTYETDHLADPEELADASDVAEAVSAIQAGQDEVLPQGWKKHTNSPSRPNAALGDFQKSMLRGISSGSGTAYNSVSNDLEGVSYSSIRDGKLTERDIYMMAQETMIRDVCRRTYREWLVPYLANPSTPLPPGKFAKFAVHEWRGRRWPWVDPNSESRYNEMARRYGWKTDETIAGEVGEDLTDNIANIRATAGNVSGTYLEQNYANEPPTQPT